jgi:hypothetical protein
MVLILGAYVIEKSLLEIYRFNVSIDFRCVLKMHFVELKMRFLPNPLIHILWDIRKFFDCLGVSKCVFHL